MVKSGLMYSYGMGFWGANGHDGIWHIALINSLAKGSIENPVFSGIQLQNYHIGFDLLIAVISRITTISPAVLYFQVVPPILALAIGLLTYRLVFTWKKSRTAALWSVFFVYFGGSWGWVVSFLRFGVISGESMFWSQQSISTLINPPYALSIALLLTGLILLANKGKKTIVRVVLISLIFGILIQVKSYAGLLALSALAVAAVFDYLRNKEWHLSIVFILSLLISIILFFPLNKDSSSLIVWQPFWFLETMMGLSDRLGWDKFFSAMTNYRMGGDWIKAFLAYGVAFVIFWFGNLGTRAIKELQVLFWIKNWRDQSWLEVFFAVMITSGVLIPVFLVQKGTPWNTIQFLYYSLFLSSILAGITVDGLLSKIKASKLFISFSILVIILTIPTTIATLFEVYIPQRAPARVTDSEVSALKFLREQPDGVVLTYPFDEAKAKEAEVNPPRPLYLYVSSAYVSAFSNKNVYLEDEVNLNIMNYPWKERRLEVENFLSSKDETYVRNFLRSNNITYIYWLKGQRAILGESQLGLSKIFENDLVDIYKVY